VVDDGDDDDDDEDGDEIEMSAESRHASTENSPVYSHASAPLAGNGSFSNSTS
jgi:hypothetical protein